MSRAGPELVKIKSGWRNRNEFIQRLPADMLYCTCLICVCDWMAETNRKNVRATRPLCASFYFMIWQNWILDTVHCMLWDLTFLKCSPSPWLIPLFGPWWQDRAFSEDTSTTEAASELHAEAYSENILNQGTISIFSLVSISDWSLSICFFCSRDDLFSFGWCP